MLSFLVLVGGQGGVVVEILNRVVILHQEVRDLSDTKHIHTYINTLTHTPYIYMYVCIYICIYIYIHIYVYHIMKLLPLV